MIQSIETSTPGQKAANTEACRYRILRLQRDGRLTNDVKLILLGQIEMLVGARRISFEQGEELRSLLGEDFLRSSSLALDLATFGRREDEVDEAA